VTAFRGNQQQQQSQGKQTSSDTPEKRTSEHAAILKQCLSVRAPGINGTSLDSMFKVATVVQQIMTELNDAESEEKE